MHELPSKSANKSTIKRVTLTASGAILFALAIFLWTYATGTMTSLVEHFWCSMVAAETCRFRGYQHFLIWTVLGIANLLILGLLLEYARGRLRR